MLEIKDLHVSVDETEILKGLSLEIKPGEIHAIMGPNGSGKSTTAYTIAGHPSYVVTSENDKSQNPNNKQISNSKTKIEKSGVFLDGEDLLEMSPDERAQAGLFLAFQYPVEIPGVKVDKFLRMAHQARFGEESEKEYSSLLKFRKYLLEVAKELEVNPALLKRGLNENFSGGEKKRLEILQMAVLQPKYAILDETDSGLDIDAIKAVAHGVKKIVTKFNTGTLVITHYQRILDYLKPDFVHVMRDGKIIESGGFELASKLEESGYHET